MFEVRVGGLSFESAPKNHARAFVITPLGLTGWADGTETRSEGGARPVAHGEFDLPVFRSGRVVTVNGAAIASSEHELAKLGQQLRGLLADGVRGVLTVEDAAGVQWANVRLAGAPRFAPHPSGLEADFQVAFSAPDPRLYGEVHTFSGASVTAYHYGNFPASPVVDVVGPVTGPYTISGPGGRLFTVTQSLTSGQTHRIDFRTGRVFRDGSLQVGAVSKAELWTVPANSSAAMSINKGTMKVTVTDTYM